MPKKKDQIIEPIDAGFDNVATSVVAKKTKKPTIDNFKIKPKRTVNVQGVEIQIMSNDDADYISLTDMIAKFDGGGSLIEAWIRNKNTIEFLGVWERINNHKFNSLEFEGIKLMAGLNSFMLSAKAWMEKVNGIGLIAKAGRYGGTFAHKDIAFEFGSWLSPEFKLYLIKEFQRLKQQEASTGQLEWNIRRTLAKAQYRTHTDAVRDYLIPYTISKLQEGFIYASEADLLNVAIFGQTSKEWKAKNPSATRSQRDSATIEQLVVFSSLESQNALLIEQGKTQQQRLLILNELARKQKESLLNNPSISKLSDKPLLIN